MLSVRNIQWANCARGVSILFVVAGEPSHFFINFSFVILFKFRGLGFSGSKIYTSSTLATIPAENLPRFG